MILQVFYGTLGNLPGARFVCQRPVNRIVTAFKSSPLVLLLLQEAF